MPSWKDLPTVDASVDGHVVTFKPISTWDKRFKEAIVAHYTGSRGAPPGKKLAWEILEDGNHRGWIGLGEPTFKLRARKRIGLKDERALPGTVNNFIYRLDADGTVRASNILKEWHTVASDGWEQRYGWRPVHWETMVQPDAVKSSNAGACFRKAGYRSLGMTTGMTASRPPGRSHAPGGGYGKRIIKHGAPLKLVLYRGPLDRIDSSGIVKQNPVARYAYHVTFSKNLAAISKRGLVPGSRSAMGRGGYAGHSGGKTFLSDKEGVDFWYERAEAAANDMSDDPLEEGFVPVVLRMPHPKTAHVDKPGSEDSRHEAWYVTQKLSGGIEVWDGSRWLPVSEWRSLDLQQAYQDGDFKYQNDNPLAQLGDDVAAKQTPYMQNPIPNKPRLRITVSTYRGRPGFLVTGTDDYGSKISIFAKTRQDAEAIRDVYKNTQHTDNRQDEIRRILLAPKNNPTSKWTKVAPNLWQNGKRHIESLGGGYYELSVGGMRFKTVKSDLAMVKRDWMWESTYESGRTWKPDPDELRQMHFQRQTQPSVPKYRQSKPKPDAKLKEDLKVLSLYNALGSAPDDPTAYSPNPAKTELAPIYDSLEKTGKYTTQVFFARRSDGQWFVKRQQKSPSGGTAFGPWKQSSPPTWRVTPTENKARLPMGGLPKLYITDLKALELLQQIEGYEWATRQKSKMNMDSIIAGEDGSTYVVLPDGEIVLDGTSTTKDKCNKVAKIMRIVGACKTRKSNPIGIGKSFKVLPLRTVKKWEPLAKRLGVSKVARSSRGFLRAYEKAGTSSRLPEEWQRKRDGFISRHMAQAKAQGERWFERDGSPTRRHLALIMWAYSPKKVG